MPIKVIEEQNKVVLTQSHADAIEKAKEEADNDLEFIVRCVANHVVSESSEEVYRIPLDILIRALYIGYEIEPTQEEKLLEMYNKQKNEPSDNQFRTEHAIKLTLDIIGMKVKGINA